MKLVKFSFFGIILVILVLIQSPAHAFNSSSFNGTSDFYAGAAPPPGIHLIDYNVYMDIRKVESKGQGVTDGKGTLTAVAFRPIYVSEKGLLGGNFLLHSIIPLLSLEADVKVPAAPGGGFTGHDGGLGDIYFGVGMAWHTPVWHWLTVLDLITPTGNFDPKKPINTGNNAFVIEPVVAVTGLFQNGMEVSAKLMYSYHTKNNDYLVPGPAGLKGYQTGQAIHMDYNVNYALTKDLKLGVTGWIWQGLENDTIGGQKRTDTKDFEFSMGPAVRYQSGKFGLIGKYVTPIYAENRIEANQLWVDLVYSF